MVKWWRRFFFVLGLGSVLAWLPPVQNYAWAACPFNFSAAYRIQAHSTDTGQVGADGIIYTQDFTTYSTTGPRREVGIRESSGLAYVLFGWVRDYASQGNAVPIVEYEDTGGSVGSYIPILPGWHFENNSLYYFKLKDLDQDGRWTATVEVGGSVGSWSYTTRDLGFSRGRPFAQAFRTDCDDAGTAHLSVLGRYPRGSTSSSPSLDWSTLKCRSDSDPNKHLDIVSVREFYVRDGQSSVGCAGTT
jgi:hypothetical protein